MNKKALCILLALIMIFPNALLFRFDAEATVCGVSTVFAGGNAYGGANTYPIYRIPSLLYVPNKNIIIAFSEGRLSSPSSNSDYGNIDMVTRISSDGGATWSNISVVIGETNHQAWYDALNNENLAGDSDRPYGAEDTWGNPTPVMRGDTIFLFLTWNDYNDYWDNTTTHTRRIFYTTSKDGLNWTKPVLVSYKGASMTASPQSAAWDASGPGCGITTKSGRTIIPCRHRIIWSDDGVNWNETRANVPGSSDEATVACLANGTILYNARSSGTVGSTYRHISYSTDGGNSFYASDLATNLLETGTIGCEGSLITHTTDWGEYLLYAHDADITGRKNLVINISLDSGCTFPYKIEVTGVGVLSGYSAMQQISANDVGILYETGTVKYFDKICFKAFDVSLFAPSNKYNDNVSVFANKVSESLSGGGTSDNPYLIQSAADFKFFANQVNSGVTYSGKFLKMTTDIDLAFHGFVSIGGSYQGNSYDSYYSGTNYIYPNKFSGTFDGDFHTVSGLKITAGDTSTMRFCVALFGYTVGATIKNIGIESGIISSSGNLVAGFVARAENSQFINCYSKARVSAVSGSGTRFIGGFCAEAVGSSVLFSNCYMSGEVLVKGGQTSKRIGGFIGSSTAANLTMEYCFCFGNVDINCSVSADNSELYYGGFCGFITNSPVLTKCGSDTNVVFRASKNGSYKGAYVFSGGKFGGFVGNASGYLYFFNGEGFYTEVDGAVKSYIKVFGDGNTSGNLTNLYTVNRGTLPIVYKSFLKNPNNQFAINERFSGSGTSDLPYIIDTIPKYIAFVFNVNTGNSYSGKYIAITQDFDLSSIEKIMPIGYGGYAFSGNLDGGNHVLNAPKVIDGNEFGTGVFGYALSAFVKNLGVKNGEIYSRSDNAGGFVGRIKTSKFVNCFATNRVKGAYLLFAGGFCGGVSNGEEAADGCTFEMCYSGGSVQCYSRGVARVGGFIGNSIKIQTYTQCYAIADVRVVSDVLTSPNEIRAGVFAGMCSDFAVLNKCLALGTCRVEKSSSVSLTRTGGFFGYANTKGNGNVLLVSDKNTSNSIAGFVEVSHAEVSVVSSKSYSFGAGMFIEEMRDTKTIYSIKYNLDGGKSSGNPSTYTRYDDTFVLNTPTKKGYDFVGWREQTVISAPKQGSIISPTGNHGTKDGFSSSDKLYCQKGVSYTVNRTDDILWMRFNNNGAFNATASKTSSFTAGQNCYVSLVYPTGTDNAYITRADTPSVMTVPSGSTGDKIYTAVWTPFEKLVLDSTSTMAIENKIAENIACKTTVKTILEQFVNDKAVVADKAESDFAGTGTVVSLVINGTVADSVTIAVKYDVSGDGVATINDCLKIKLDLRGITPLEGIYKQAADSNSDGILSVTDYLRCVRAVTLSK